MSSDVEALATKSAAEIGRAFETGGADPRALAELCLERAQAAPDVYVRVTAERARREAAAAADRARRGLRRGPLDGVPFSWKDLYDVAGVPTEMGSKLLEGRVATADCPLVARAARAGTVCIGKTHLSELAFSGLGYNPVTATPDNHYAPGHAPGGSSSGAAASVRSGSAAVGVGSDTGGSVRIPAAWNGLVGLKTTIGSLPMEGVRPLSPSLDTAGPLVRTVEDAALSHAVMADRRPPDLAGVRIKGLRLLTPPMFRRGLDGDRAVAFDTACAALIDAGAVILDDDAPEFEEVVRVGVECGAFVNSEAYGVWRETIEASPDVMFHQILKRFRGGADLLAHKVDRGRIETDALRARLASRLAAYDAVLAPTSPNTPPLIERLANDATVYARENLRALQFTRLANVLNLASITVPTPAPSGSPFPGAAMLSVPAHGESRLLRVAAAAETILANA